MTSSIKAPTSSAPIASGESKPGGRYRVPQQYANDLYTNEVESGGLTQRQFAVLFAVEQQEGVSQTVLVRMTGIDRSTLADMIVRMQNKDLLARKRTEEDQRANAVRITPTGRRALRATLPAVARAEAQLLEALSPRQRTEFVKMLTTIKDKAKATALEESDDGKARARKRR